MDGTEVLEADMQTESYSRPWRRRSSAPNEGLAAIMIVGPDGRVAGINSRSRRSEDLEARGGDRNEDGVRDEDERVIVAPVNRPAGETKT